MSIQNDIKEEMKVAMKAREAEKLTVLRGLLSAFTNEVVSKGRKPDEELSDEDALSVIMRQVKQRKDSIEQFEKGGRPELAEAEKSELQVLEKYLPAQMTDEGVEAAAKAKQAELGIVDASGKNQLMGALMKDLKGKVDGNRVRDIVEKILG